MSAPSQRIPYLDALRAVAIFFVLGAHKYAFPVWRNSGWIGVDLFFVLSGFLVSGLLFSEFIKHRRISVGWFLVRRVFKIYPAFMCMLTATFLIEVSRRSEITPSKWLAEALFVQNYFPSVYGHTWSLAVEIHFYLILAFFLQWASRRAPSAADPFGIILPVALAVSVAALALRVVTAAYPPEGAFDVRDHLCPTHLRLDSLMFGVMISYWYHFHNDRFLDFARRRRSFILFVSCLLLAPVVWLGAESALVYTVGYTCLYMGFGGILVYCLGLPPRRSAGSPSLRLAAAVVGCVGFYSYGIYLWHMLVESLGISIIRRILHGPFHYLAEFSVYAVMSILAGVVMTELTELPAIRIRDSLFPSRGRLAQSGSEQFVNALKGGKAEADQTSTTGVTPGIGTDGDGLGLGGNLYCELGKSSA